MGQTERNARVGVRFVAGPRPTRACNETERIAMQRSRRRKAAPVRNLRNARSSGMRPGGVNHGRKRPVPGRRPPRTQPRQQLSPINGCDIWLSHHTTLRLIQGGPGVTGATKAVCHCNSIPGLTSPRTRLISWTTVSSTGFAPSPTSTCTRNRIAVFVFARISSKRGTLSDKS